MTIKITIEDVCRVAKMEGIGVLQALLMMQTVCAKSGDEETLMALCDVKNEILFGDET